MARKASFWLKLVIQVGKILAGVFVKGAGAKKIRDMATAAAEAATKEVEDREGGE